MEPVLTLAERIVRATDREHPADALLRQTLQPDKAFAAGQRRQITRAVLSYFRWWRWMEGERPFAEQIKQALKLAERFARNPSSYPDTELAARVVADWVETEMKITPEMARALQSEPKLWLRAQLGQGRALAGKLGDCRVFGPGPLADILEYRGQQDLFRTVEFHRGEFELQDISSQAVGLICAPQAGETWWDVCAGEGGKLLHLSALMHNKGLIWASDRAAWRLQRLKRRTARAQVFNYRAVPWNGGAKLPTRTRFDGVLLDAPCSGTGTWQRNPDRRWTTTARDVEELTQIQKQLLGHASQAVKPGGKLVYAVCTLTDSETSEVVEFFEKQHPEYKQFKFPHPLAPEAPPRTQLTLGPEQFGGNGMFIAAWQRS
jgi:16S rRNA (cytosine967-C5)-methyltransferase